MAVVKNKSSEGLSLISFELELIAAALHTAYGYIHTLALAAYGEAVVMFLQGLVLNTAIYTYAKTPLLRPAVIYIAICFAATWVLQGDSNTSHSHISACPTTFPCTKSVAAVSDMGWTIICTGFSAHTTL